MTSALNPFFKAKGVAIIGASTKPNKLSYGILENLLINHYEGSVYPVNPSATEILGLKVYSKITNIPDPVDLAVIVLPAEKTIQALEECAERGIKAVVIITGGFREVGEKGAALEQAALQIARNCGMRVVGPNCVGTMDMASGLNTTFIKGMPERGPIAFISQSGAVCGGVVDLIIESKIGFSHFASIGNEMDVTETDMLEYFGDDPDVRVIAMYVEGIQDGARFISAAREVVRKKPIVILKAGKNNAGARAVSSHTGSLAGAYSAYQAAFKQTGIIEVQNLNELFNVSWALGTQPLPKGKRVAITTNAGGAAALLADNLASNGFELASLKAQIQADLHTKLNPSAQVSNPVDMLGQAEPQDYEWSLTNIDRDSGVDILVPILVPQALVNPIDVAQAWADFSKTTKKTLLTCLMGERSVREARALLNLSGVPVFQYPEHIGPVLNAMHSYATTLKRKPFLPIITGEGEKEKLAYFLDNLAGKEELGEYESREILSSYGIKNIPGELARTKDEATRIADKLGYPVVLKIVAKGLLHKSDSGGIRLNIQDQANLEKNYDDLISYISNIHPATIIAGVLVEKMSSRGQEVIIGMRQDATFGPMIMFGMGGIAVELIKDISFKIAPLSKEDITELFDSTIAGKMLMGFRGTPKRDIKDVIDVISRLSQIALDFPRIKEIEINPLVVLDEGKGTYALDSRAIITSR